MKKLKFMLVVVAMMFCLGLAVPIFAESTPISQAGTIAAEFSQTKKVNEAVIVKDKSEMKKVRDNIFKGLMDTEYFEYDPDKKVATICGNNGTKFVINGVNSEKEADQLFDKVSNAENEQVFQEALMGYSGNFYCEGIKIGSKAKNEEANFLYIPNKTKNGVESYTKLDESGKSIGTIPVKGMDKEQKQNVLVSLVSKPIKQVISAAQVIIKGNTYYNIKQTKTSLQITNQNGKVLKTIDIKGMKKEQITALKTYYSKNILGKSSKDKNVQNKMKSLDYKAEGYRVENKIEKQYGKKGLSIIRNIAGKLWNPDKFVDREKYVLKFLNKYNISNYTKLKEVKNKFNKLYEKDFWGFNTDDNFKKAVRAVAKK